jgi:ribosomal protein S27E
MKKPTANDSHKWMEEFHMGIKCPGCDEELTVENAGGYRNFCEKCVKSMPEFPKDGKGYLIKIIRKGKEPIFEWD